MSTEVNEAPKYNFQMLTDFSFVLFCFFLITKHEICERLKTKRFPSVIPYQIYKVGQNDVLELDLMWVHHRVDSEIKRTIHPLRCGGRLSFDVFASELSDEMVKYSPEVKIICRARRVECLV